MKYYLKFLDPDRQPYHGRGQWPEPGVWTETIEDISPCKRGYHLSRLQDFFEWCYIPVLWVAEAEGVSVLENKVVAKRARLIRQVPEWNECNQRLFAADCAEHVIHLFESVFLYDKRPQHAIKTARKFAFGETTKEKLNAALLAAMRVADAALYAAQLAAESAALSAREFPWSAARTSAALAVKSVGVADSAAGAAEHQWQLDTLFSKYLNLNPEEFE